MGCHRQISSIAIDDWRCHLGVRVNSAVNTITDPDEIRSDANDDILALIN